MRNPIRGVAMLAAAAILAFAAPAAADNYDVKDGNGAHQTFAGKLISGVLHPRHLLCALSGGVCQDVTGDGAGNLNVNVAAASDLRSGAGTITAADAATTSAAGQSGVSQVTGTPTANASVTWALNGHSSATLAVSGTFVATSQIEASADGGTTFVPATAKILGTGATSSTVTGPGVFRVDVTGMTHVRLRASAFTSGTLTAKAVSSSAPGLTQVLNPVRLADGAGAVMGVAGNPLVTSIPAFNPTGSATLAVTTTSARVALPSADPTALVRNTGASDAYLAFGSGSVTATTSGVLLPAGHAVAFNVGSATNVAAITASGASSLAVSTGTGVPALTGGGGGSGGGAITVADGADVTLGAKADAACATPSTSCTIAQILKGFLAAAQDTSTASAVNQTQVNGVTIATSNGVVGTGVQRVAIASDNTAFSVNAAITAAINTLVDGSNVTLGAKADGVCATATGTCTLQALIKFLNTAATSPIPACAASPCVTTIGRVGIDQTTDGTTNAVHLVAGTAIAGKVGIDQTTDGTTNAVHLVAGTAIAGKVGIDQTTDGTTNAVHLVAGTALAGKVGIDQTTVGTTNGFALAQIGPNTILTGNGITGTGSQRVTVASDNTPFAVKIDQTTHGTTDQVAADLTKIGGTATVNGGLAGSLGVGGTAAANATATGNPVKAGCTFSTGTTAATTGQLQFVACDGFGNTGRSITPSMATQITASSANVANASAVATLAAAVGKTTYINGFVCTGAGATAASVVTVTVAGVITGTMNYTVAVPAGVSTGITPLNVSFPNPVSGSAANTAIVVTMPALGTGNTNATCNAQGFQQ